MNIISPTFTLMESKMPGTIVVLDDDVDVLLSARLYLEAFFERVIPLEKPEALIPTLKKESVDVVLLDMNYHRGKNDGSEGLALLKEVKHTSSAEAVVMTAYGDVNVAVEAIKIGAFDFIVKPWVNEKLRATLMAALKLKATEQERNQLAASQRAWNDQLTDDPIIGESPAIEGIRSMVEQVAPTDANILLLGENGTGKEVIAKQLHANSLRSAKPFIKVDLGAIPESLFEAELFGVKKGAFTDAKQDKPGRFQLANGGTLFLDEIGNLGLAQQVKLLSVLQNRTVQPVGGSQSEPIDVRLVTATNADLDAMIQKGEFRQDLLYRIKTIEFMLPPLRDREADVVLLANHFLERFKRKYAKRGLRLGSAGVKKLMSYDWPGNVRELQHGIERAVILSQSEIIDLSHIMPTRVMSNAQSGENETLESVERKHIEQVLQAQQGNISKAAKVLGLTRAALYRRLEKFGI